MTRANPTAPHPTFDELGAARDRGEITEEQVYPCVCWTAGNGEAMNGERQRLTREQAQHPEEFDAGYRAWDDEQRDI